MGCLCEIKFFVRLRNIFKQFLLNILIYLSLDNLSQHSKINLSYHFYIQKFTFLPHLIIMKLELIFLIKFVILHVSIEFTESLTVYANQRKS